MAWTPTAQSRASTVAHISLAFPASQDRRMRVTALALAGLALVCCDSPAQPQRSAEASAPPVEASDGETMVTIPAGRYPIGRDSGPESLRPHHVVSLAAFRIGRTEVTNAAFAKYLDALRLPVRGSFLVGRIGRENADAQTLGLLTTHPYGARYRSYIELDDDDSRIVLAKGRFVPVRGQDRHPVTEVTWYGARAYCLWRGGDLPTEVQWEAAARGADDRLYPWGNKPPTPERIVFGGLVGATEPVGSRPSGASPFGALDMAGSLAEWTRSLKRPYPYRADDGRESLVAAGERTTRGGDYEYDGQAVYFTVSFRDGFSNNPVHGHRHVGFRCTKSP